MEREEPFKLMETDIFAFLQQPEKTKNEARNLAIAVMRDAFRRLLYLDGPKTQKKAALEAKEWFLSTDETWPYSFYNLCHMLNISPSAVRVLVYDRITKKETSAVMQFKDEHE